jgi:hypothetical protein
MVQLAAGTEAVKRPSIACRWCALLPDCAEGDAMLREVDGTD